MDDDKRVICQLMELAPKVVDCYPALGLAHALDILGSRVFHGLVVDVLLPDGSGLDLLDRWIDRFPSAPAVVITAQYQDPRSARHAFVQGRRFLPKPLRKPEFDAFLTDVCAYRWSLSRTVAAKLMRFAGRHLLTHAQADLLARFTRNQPRHAVVAELEISPNTLKTRIEQLRGKVGATTMDRACEMMMEEP